MKNQIRIFTLIGFHACLIKLEFPWDKDILNLEFVEWEILTNHTQILDEIKNDQILN